MTVVKNSHHLDMDGHRIANLDDPTSDTEAATKGYVDRAIATAIADYEARQKQDAVTPAPVVRSSPKNV